MNFVTAFAAWFSCVIIVLTAWAMLQDARKVPYDRTPRGWLQHVCRLLLLDLMTAFAGVVVVIPSVWPATVWSTGPLTVLALFMAIQSPCPWWRYVFQNRGRSDSPSGKLHAQL